MSILTDADKAKTNRFNCYLNKCCFGLYKSGIVSRARQAFCCSVWCCEATVSRPDNFNGPPQYHQLGPLLKLRIHQWTHIKSDHQRSDIRLRVHLGMWTWCTVSLASDKLNQSRMWLYCVTQTYRYDNSTYRQSTSQLKSYQPINCFSNILFIHRIWTVLGKYNFQ